MKRCLLLISVLLQTGLGAFGFDFADSLRRQHFKLVYYEDSSSYGQTILQSEYSIGELTFRTSTLRRSLVIRSCSVEALQVSETSFDGQFVLENVHLSASSYVSNGSHIRYLSLANVSGSRLIISNSTIDTLYCIMNPGNARPSQILVENSSIGHLVIVTDGFFEAPPPLRLSSVDIVSIDVLASALAGGVNLSRCKLSRDFSISRHNNYGQLAGIKNSAAVLYGLSQQYRDVGDIEESLRFRYLWKREENLQNIGVVRLLNIIRYDYLGGRYFTSIGGVLGALLLGSFVFCLIYMICGLFSKVAEVVPVSYVGIPEANVGVLYNVRWREYKSSKRSFLHYAGDCFLFAISHFISLRSDRTFNLSYFIWIRPVMYVSFGWIRILTFLQLIIGLWCTYAIAMCLLSRFQGA